MSQHKTEPRLFIELVDHYRDEGKDGSTRNIQVYPRFTIGRDDSCDIVIHSNTVSSRHAEFILDSDKGIWKIRDLGSSNGIIFDDKKVREHKLNEEDRLFLGEALLTIHFKEELHEKTEIFTVLGKLESSITARNLVTTLAGIGAFLFFYFNLQYFQTVQESYKSLLGLLLYWFISWVSSVVLSWFSLKSFQFVRLAMFQLQAWVILCLATTVYPVISISFFSAKLDAILSTFFIFCFCLVYLALLIEKLQRWPSLKRSFLISGAICLLTLIGVQLSDQFSEKTLLDMRYARPLILPSKSNDLLKLEDHMDKVYEQINKTSQSFSQ